MGTFSSRESRSAQAFGLASLAVVVSAALIFSESSRAVEADAAGPMVKLVDFRDVKLIDALNMLADQTGTNMVASPDAAKTVVSMTLRNVPVKLAVETLCKANNLWFKDDAGIMRVMTTQEFQRDLTTFREEKTEVYTLLYPNAVSVAVAIRDLYGDRVQLSLRTEERTDQTDDLNDRFDRFDIVNQRSQGLGNFQNGNNGASSGINSGSVVSGAGVGSVGSSVSSGRGSSTLGSAFTQRNTNQRTTDEANGALRAMTSDDLQAMKRAEQTGDNDAIELLLQQYRRKKSDIYISLSRRNNLVAVRTSDAKSLEEIGKLVRRLDVPTSIVLLEVKILSIDLGNDMNSAFDFQFSNGAGLAGGFNNGDIQPPASDLLKGSALQQAPLTLGGTGLTPGNLAFQYVDKNFRARLQALEDKNKATTLATPMLMTANSEVSQLFVGDQRPIVQGIISNTVTSQVNSVTSSNTPLNFVPVGTTLLITPNINADRTVTLRILQQNSSIKPGAATIPVVTDQGVTQQPVDVVSTQTVSGTVVASDGLTLAIGGLIEENISDMKAQVPLLGNIPGIGVLFRRQTKNKSRSEIIILIRPRILTTPCEGAAASKELLEQLSIHPKAQDPQGTLNLYTPMDVLPAPKKVK